MTKKLDFKISTGLKNIIGKELISEAYTAIFELVKNSYDADATSVKIVFQNIVSSDRHNHSKILIIDNGNGMSYNDILSKWLFVGYSTKKIKDLETGEFRNKISNRKRIMAGAKGIGRFSADRLGGQLNLYTKIFTESTVHNVRMNWDLFEDNQEKEFQNIHVEYEPLNKFPKLSQIQDIEHGTILEIFHLADQWDKAKLVKLKKYLQRLVNPIQISGNEDFEIQIVANEFLDDDKKSKKKGRPKHEIINGKITNIVFEKLGIRTTEINCKIRDLQISIEIMDKGRFVFRTKEANPYKKLHDIDIRIFYLNREAKKIFTRIMGIQPVQFGSIFLYKNGFRIHPYGDEKDDWLGLEKRKAQGRMRYLSAREMIGRIEINGIQNGFREVSSRHGGVIITEEFNMLLDFIKTRAVRWLERYVVDGLEWDNPKEGYKKSDADIRKDSLKLVSKFTDQIKDPHKLVEFNPILMEILEEKQADDLSEAVKNIETLALFTKSDDEKARIKKYATRVRSAARAYAEKKARQIAEASKKEILFLQKSQSLDTKLTEDYNHWIHIATGNIKTYLKQLVNAIRQNQTPEYIFPIVELISKENQRIATVASIISQANFNIQTKEKTSDIVTYMIQYITNIISEWAKRIEFIFINQQAKFETKFVPLEISIMVDNFVSNSRKARATRLTMKFSVNDQALHILISDNGKGISDENKPLIFKRGFTSTIGSGIGLNHIKSVVEKMHGSIEFVGNGVVGMDSGACFEMVINADRR